MSSSASRRSKRNLPRPDYRIRTIDELEVEASPTLQVTKEQSPSPTPAPESPSPPPFATRKSYDCTIPLPPAFPYEWTFCKAELMNLATLKKHIAVVHSSDAFAFKTCRWGECGQSGPGQLGRREAFEDIYALNEHVEQQHLRPIAWRMGDGVGSLFGGVAKAETSEDPAAQYLFHNGVQVTPSVKNQKMLTECQRHAWEKEMAEMSKTV